ncbi:MAG: hypothetical protein ACFCVA_13040 [Gammaproteobacteria bacterium]
MNVIWGTILVIFTLVLSWLAQVVNAFLPSALAAKWGLNEPESDVDATLGKLLNVEIQDGISRIVCEVRLLGP